MEKDKWYERDTYWQGLRGTISVNMQLGIAHSFRIDNEGNLEIEFRKDLERGQDQ